MEEHVLQALSPRGAWQHVMARLSLRDELEEELRAKIQAQAAVDGGLAPPDGLDEAAPAGELETSR